MNERSAPSKTGGRIGAVERCGRGAGAGTRAGAQQPSFSLSLVACSLSLRAFWCCWWDLLSSLCCRIHFCSEYHILSQALEDSSAQTNNSLFITPFIGRDFGFFAFYSPPPSPTSSLLRFFLRNWVQQIERARFLFCHLLHHRLCSLFIHSTSYWV